MTTLKIPTMNILITRGLQLLLFIMIPLFALSNHYARALVAAAAVLFSFLPAIVRRNYNVTVPWLFEFLIAFLLLMHLVGLYLNFYELLWWWDKVAHLAGSAVIAALGFYGVLAMQMSGKIHLNLRMMALVAFMLAVTIGALWEIVEFTSDTVLHTHNQYGNTDTMVDLIDDTIAAAIVGIGGSWYARRYAHNNALVIDMRRTPPAQP